VVDALLVAASRMPDAPLLRHAGRTLTFAEVARRMTVVASGLQHHGLAPGERVAIALPNGLDYPTTWLATLAAGGVSVPVNVSYRAADLRHILIDAVPRVAVAEGEIAERIKEICASEGLFCVVVEPSALLNGAEVDSTLGLPPRATGDMDRLANLQYTSGTTGFPKACMLTHGYWTEFGKAMRDVFKWTPRDVVLTVQPFTYLDPQWKLTACVLSGATLVIESSFSPSQYWEVVRSEGATIGYVIGAMPALLLKQPPGPFDRDHRLRLMLCSGIPPRMHDALERRWGAPWREVYGMTESGFDLYVPVEDRSCVGSGAVGRPAPGKTIHLVDDEGVKVPTGSQGEMVIAGGVSMRGYWNQPDATSRTIKADGLHTGDLAVVEQNGYVRIVGRKKDMIRRSGENVSAAEVENVLCGDPRVRACAIVAVADEIRGDEIRAVVTLADIDGIPDLTGLAADLARYVGSNLARFKIPRYFTFMDDLPMTPSGRVAKHLLPPHDEPLTRTIDLGERKVRK